MGNRQGDEEVANGRIGVAGISAGTGAAIAKSPVPGGGVAGRDIGKNKISAFEEGARIDGEVGGGRFNGAAHDQVFRDPARRFHAGVQFRL